MKRKLKLKLDVKLEMQRSVDVLHGDGKYYPKTSELLIGEVFERLPRELSHIRIEGTYPLYGRLINSVTRVSEHKLEVVLGYNLVGVVKHNVITSDETLIAIYGEIDLYIKDSKCQMK